LSTEESKSPTSATYLVDSSKVQALEAAVQDVAALGDSPPVEKHVAGIQAVVLALNALFTM